MRSQRAAGHHLHCDPRKLLTGTTGSRRDVGSRSMTELRRLMSAAAHERKRMTRAGTPPRDIPAPGAGEPNRHSARLRTPLRHDSTRVRLRQRRSLERVVNDRENLIRVGLVDVVARLEDRPDEPSRPLISACITRRHGSQSGPRNSTAAAIARSDRHRHARVRMPTAIPSSCAYSPGMIACMEARRTPNTCAPSSTPSVSSAPRWSTSSRCTRRTDSSLVESLRRSSLAKTLTRKRSRD